MRLHEVLKILDKEGSNQLAYGETQGGDGQYVVVRESNDAVSFFHRSRFDDTWSVYGACIPVISWMVFNRDDLPVSLRFFSECERRSSWSRQCT